MDEPIIIPLVYKGEEREFRATLQSWAYGHRFLIDVDGVELIIELDDEGSYRGIVSPERDRLQPNAELIQAIIDTLQSL